MNTAELNVAVSASTLLNMAQVAVDVAKRLSGRSDKEELQARSTFVLLKENGAMSDEYADIEGVQLPQTMANNGVDVEESSIPFQIATDLMARSVTTLIKFK